VVGVLAAAGVVIVAGFGITLFGNSGGGTRVSAGEPARLGPATFYAPHTPLSTPSTRLRPEALPQGPSSTTIARADPTAALDQLVRSYGKDYASSGVIQTPTGNLAAVSYNAATPASGTNPHVTIFAFDGSAWIKITDITLDLGGTVFPPNSNATPITTVHLSGSPTPDFAVIVNYNDGPAAAIISRAGGSWHPLTFSGGPHGGDEIINPTFTAAAVTERANTCTPTCAAGNYTTTSYRYSPQSRRMVAVG
jgi:hypothetical protein